MSNIFLWYEKEVSSLLVTQQEGLHHTIFCNVNPDHPVLIFKKSMCDNILSSFMMFGHQNLFLVTGCPQSKWANAKGGLCAKVIGRK